MMIVDGSCHCGATSILAEIDPETVTICHCTDCQKLSANAFRVAVPAAVETTQFTGAAPKVYIKTADNGNRRVQAFCATCGSQFYSADATDTPAVYMLRVGILRQSPILPPKREIWSRSRLPWVWDFHEETESHETR